MKNPGKSSHLLEGPFEPKDNGYSAEQAEKDWQALQKDAAFARRQGFIDLFKLVRILAYEDQYSTDLPRLWEEYECGSYGAPELDVHTVRGRHSAWWKLLDRFTHNELSRVWGKSILSKIQPLPLRSDDKDYVNLDDLAEYFERILEIPLPALLFPSEKHVTNSSLHSQADDAREERDKIQYALLKTGPTWQLIFEGAEISGLKEKGWRYIQYLLERPRRTFTVWEISKDVDDADPSYIGKASDGSIESLDSEDVGVKAEKRENEDPYLLGLREKYSFDKAEEQKAENDHDYERVTLHRARKEECEDALKAYLAKNRDLRTSPEKIQHRINQSMNRSLIDLERHNRKAFLHFKSALGTIYTKNLSYNPSEDIPWLTR